MNGLGVLLFRFYGLIVEGEVGQYCCMHRMVLAVSWNDIVSYAELIETS